LYMGGASIYPNQGNENYQATLQDSSKHGQY
jgi:hypothetical protein